MDPLKNLKDEQLVQFLHCRKTELSVIDSPQNLLNQLNDYDLLPKEMYQKVSRMRSIKVKQQGVYDLLDWVEKERPEDIKQFWRCVFKDHLRLQYPAVRQLYNYLKDGSITLYEKLPEKKEETKKRKKALEKGSKEKGNGNIVEKKKKTSTESSEEEQAGPSSMQTPRKRKKVQKPTFGTPLVKGQKNDIWNWTFYKTSIPVTCGDQKGTLYRDKLSRWEKCILVKDKWFTPSGFEALGGRKSSKNWKRSIRCRNTTLDELIQKGHLTSPRFKRNRINSPQTKRTLFPCNRSERSIVSDSESEDYEESDMEEKEESDEDKESDEDSDKEGEQRKENKTGGSETEDSCHDADEAQVFKVTCGAISGTLHKCRFATETCGKSIRTEDSWMTPMEFLRAGSASSDNWRGEIQCEGRPLSSLMEEGDLAIHSMCVCPLCSSDPEDLEEQCNDDVCFICRSQGHLVMCEKCPRSYHQKCHLPSVDDTLIKDDSDWVCTVCVYLTSQEWYLQNQNTLQEAQTFLVSKHVLKCQYLLMYMFNADEEQIFATDSCLKVKGYTCVIKTPMWLEKVKKRLQQDHYQTIQQFMNDILLIFENCAIFNRNNAEFREMGVKLQGLFEGEFKKVFRVQQ